MASFTDRIVGATKLSVPIYEEVEADKGATGQAMAVVILSSVAGGIGAISLTGPDGILTGTLAALIGWVAWAFLTYLLGTRVFAEPQTSADVGELLRTTGFASAPGLIRVVGIVPGIGMLVLIVAQFWMLAAMVVGVRQALDFTSTWRAVLVCLAGWLLSFIIAIVVGLLFGPVAQ